MTNRAWRIRGRCFQLAVATLLFVVSAVAVDESVYNGSECTFTEPDHVDGQERSYIKLWNQSGQTETIGCPVLRDQATADVEHVYLIGSDDITSNTCLFWEREDDFSYSSWAPDSVQTITSDYDKIRWFDSTAYANTTPYASYQITCDLPNGAGVYIYYVEEK